MNDSGILLAKQRVLINRVLENRKCKSLDRFNFKRSITEC